MTTSVQPVAKFGETLLEGYPFHCELLETRPSEDCGCPEEEWAMGNIQVILHLEEDGGGHIHFDTGDWEHDIEHDIDHNAEPGGTNEKTITMESLRIAAAEYINTLPMEE